MSERKDSQKIKNIKFKDYLFFGFLEMFKKNELFGRKEKSLRDFTERDTFLFWWNQNQSVMRSKFRIYTIIK